MQVCQVLLNYGYDCYRWPDDLLPGSAFSPHPQHPIETVIGES